MELRKSGLKGLRASAEMPCFFRHGKIREFTMYEDALHREFSFPGMGICAYNVREMEGSGQLDLLMRVLRAHNKMIVTGPIGSAILETEEADDNEIERMMAVDTWSRSMMQEDSLNRESGTAASS